MKFLNNKNYYQSFHLKNDCMFLKEHFSCKINISSPKNVGINRKCNSNRYIKKRLKKTRMVKSIILLIFLISLGYGPAESISDCDSLRHSFFESEDKNLINYIIRYDIKDSYDQRNTDFEKCSTFLKKLNSKLNYYTSFSDDLPEEIINDEENVKEKRHGPRQSKQSQKQKALFHFKY